MKMREIRNNASSKAMTHLLYYQKIKEVRAWCAGTVDHADKQLERFRKVFRYSITRKV